MSPKRYWWEMDLSGINCFHLFFALAIVLRMVVLDGAWPVRSVLETRDVSTPVQHLKAANAAGVLAGLVT